MEKKITHSIKTKMRNSRLNSSLKLSYFAVTINFLIPEKDMQKNIVTKKEY
jgi:hypothetical protein